MKRAISLILVLVLCLSLSACSSKVSLKTWDVRTAIDDYDGTLKMKTVVNGVSSFTYLIEDVDTDTLKESNVRRAISRAIEGDISSMRLGDIEVYRVIGPVMSILVLFVEDEASFAPSDLVNSIVEIVCDEQPVFYGGWMISAEINHDNNSVLIEAKPDYMLLFG